MYNEQLREYLSNYPTREWREKTYAIDDRMAAQFQEIVESSDAVFIMGDYDTDGICASKILKDGLKALYPDKTISVLLPDRFRDGYGMNRKQIDKIVNVLKQMKERGISFAQPCILTCDNGITCHDVIDYAKEQIPNLKVIVTDHHLPKSEQTQSSDSAFVYMLPRADLICNPHCKDEGFSYEHYCGAGVCLKLLLSMMDEQEKQSKLIEQLVVLAGIATVADMVPLEEDNWCIVRKSLDILREQVGDRAASRRMLPALRMMLHTLGIEHASQINEEVYAYQISPLMNAMGRLQDYGAQKMFRFLDNPTQDVCEAIFLNNQNRKELVNHMTDTFSQRNSIQHHEGDSPIWLYIPAQEAGAEEGLCGLYAQKIAEQYHVPAIVVTNSRVNPDILKGSGRNVDGFDLHAYLKETVGDKVLGFGGHKEACGLTCTMEQLRAISRDPSIRDAARFYQTQGVQKPPRLHDSICHMLADYKEMQQEYAPFGKNFAKPVYAVELYSGRERFRSMGDGSHFYTILSDAPETKLKVIHFFHDPEELSNPDNFIALGSVSENYYKGQVSYQFIADAVEDVPVREQELTEEQEMERL